MENKSFVFHFDDVEVREREFTLIKAGKVLAVEPKAFRALLFLLRNPGRLIPKEELLKSLWGDVAVTDGSLTRCIWLLRRLLEDDLREPRYIETVATVGYRFVCPVKVSEDGKYGAMPLATTPSVQPTASRRTILLVLAILLGGFVGIMGFLWITHRLNSRSSVLSDPKALRTVPFTTAAGQAVFPVFSPDGREIAFVWDGSNRDDFDIYVQLVGADLPLRLTHHKRGHIGRPAWSPDGGRIAFERCDGKQNGLYVVPALGGEERKLSSSSCPYLPSDVAWAANGKILFLDQCTKGGTFGVVDLSLATGEKRCLMPSGAEEDADNGFGDYGYGFALSPDASTIAVGTLTTSGCCRLLTIPVEGGPINPVISDNQMNCEALDLDCGVMWTPDGNALVYSTGKFSLPALFRVSITGAKGERERTYPAIGSFNRDGTRFAYSQITSSEGPAVWRADLLAPGGPLRGKGKIISSQFPEASAQLSPDGTQLIWESGRTGSSEIFISDASGRDQRQLTHLNRFSGTPRWSPDGKWIAFDSLGPTEKETIFVVDHEGRNLHSITSKPFDCVTPSWSRNGNAIYFSGSRGGKWQVWKQDMQSGIDVQLTHQGGFNPIESVDGKTVFYSRFDEGGIWQIPTSGGAEIPVIPDRPQARFWGYFAVTSTGLYFLDNDAEPHPSIEFFHFASRHISKVLTLDQNPLRFDSSLSANPDGKTIYFTLYDRQSVIKIMEFTR